MRIGVLDLGSNSFHLLVADASESGRLRRVDQEKRNLRLGDLVARHSLITDAAADEAVTTVRQLRDRAISSGARFVFGAATSAFRDAPNGRSLLNRIEAETGVHAKLIDGCEEGRLVFEAVQSSMNLPRDPVACLDLGGGSLEVVVGTRSEILWSASLPLGVVRLRAQLMSSEHPTARQRQNLCDHVAQVIAAKASPAFGFHPTQMIGAGGTFRSIARMVAAQRDSTIPASINGMTIERCELLDVSESLQEMPAETRRQLPGMGRRRAELAPAGLLIVLAAMQEFGHEQITVAEWTLREGMILDAVTKGRDSHWLESSRALAVAIRHEIDLPHAEAVATIALRLFDAIEGYDGFTPSDRSLLAEAALLHDIGRTDGSDSHAKAGARIVLRELGGPGHPRCLELASLVRSHTSCTPKQSYEAFRSLKPRRQEVVAALLPVLRLADLLAKTSQVADITIRSVAGGISLGVEAANSAADVWELQQRAQDLQHAVGCMVEVNRESPAVAFDSAAR